jgi:hypothetical protein
VAAGLFVIARCVTGFSEINISGHIKKGNKWRVTPQNAFERVLSAEEERRALFLFRKVPRRVSVPGVVFSCAFHLVVNCLSASLLPHRCDPASGGCSKRFGHCLVGRRGGQRRTCRNSYRPRSKQRTLLTEGFCMRECSSVDAVHVKRFLVLTASGRN